MHITKEQAAAIQVQLFLSVLLTAILFGLFYCVREGCAQLCIG